jgi:hypothetical protein
MMIRQTLAAVLCVACLLATGCGDSPTEPSTPTPTLPTAPAGAITPIPNAVVYSYEIPAGVTAMQVVAHAQPQSCHRLQVLVEQEPLVDETVGSCGSALDYDKVHPVKGRRIEVRTTPLNNSFVWWIVTH